MDKQPEFIAVDFDGTLCVNNFPEIGEPKQAVIAYIRMQAARGSKIILNTCRENGTRNLLDEAVSWCAAHAIPLDAVNENPFNKYREEFKTPPPRKVYADLYIDDKAVNVTDIEREVLGFNQEGQP